MHITDSVLLGDVQVGDDGYLEAFVRTARIGCQQYRGAEVKRPDLGMVNVYRDEAAVFDKSSLRSFSHIAMCVDHPPEKVTSKNWRKYAVGTTGGEVLRDGEYLKIGIKIKDADAVQAVRDGKRELSVGYSADLVWEDGKAPDGTPYQARMTGITANHIALVAKGRAGPQCCIGDSWSDLGDGRPSDLDEAHNQQRTKPMALKQVMFDGIQIEVTEQGSQAIDKLTTKLADSTKMLDARDGEITGLKKAVETKDGEIAGLKKTHDDAIKVKDAALAAAEANIDKKIEERQTAIVDAATVAGKEIDPKGKTIQAIRREAVIANMGDTAVKDRSDDYVEAVFTTLVAKGPAKDTLRDGIQGSLAGRRTGGGNEAQTAYQEMLDGLNGVAKKEAR